MSTASSTSRTVPVRWLEGGRSAFSELTYGSRLMRPEPFAQCALEDFAGAGLRQLEIGELDATWNLVTGQRSTAVRDQLIHTERDAGFQHDTRHDQLPPLGIGYAARPRAYVWIIARAPRVPSVDFGVGNARTLSLSHFDGTLVRSVQMCGVGRAGGIRDED